MEGDSRKRGRSEKGKDKDEEEEEEVVGVVKRRRRAEDAEVGRIDRRLEGLESEMREGFRRLAEVGERVEVEWRSEVEGRMEVLVGLVQQGFAGVRADIALLRVAVENSFEEDEDAVAETETGGDAEVEAEVGGNAEVEGGDVEMI